MLDPISQGILSRLATQAIMAAGRLLGDSQAARRLHDSKVASRIREMAFGPQSISNFSKVFKIAIRRANRTGLTRADLDAFFSRGTNAQIIASWLWDPERAATTIEDLDFLVVPDRATERNLQRFAEVLPAALSEAFQEVYPESWATVETLRVEIRRTVGDEHAVTREQVQKRSDQLADAINAGRAEGTSERQQMMSMLASIGENQDRSFSKEVEEAIGPRIDTIEKLRKAGRLQEALSRAEQLLEFVRGQDLPDKSLLAAHQQLADCFLSTMDRQEQSVPHLKEVSRLTDNASRAHRALALVALLEERPAEGLREIDRALEYAGDDPDERKKSVLIRANLLSLQGCHEEAFDVLWLVADLEDAQDLNHLSTFATKAGRYDWAREYSRQALELNPGLLDAHAGFGYAAVLEVDERNKSGSLLPPEGRARLIREGLYHLNEAIDGYDPQRTGRIGQAFFNRGMLHIECEDLSAAKADFKHAIELDAGSGGQALTNLAYACLHLEDYEEGLNYLKRLKSLNPSPNDLNLLYLEYSLRSGAEDPEAGIQVLKQALEAKDEEASRKSSCEDTAAVSGAAERDEEGASNRLGIRLLLAKAYHRAIQPSKARALLDELRSEHPDDSRPLLELGTQACDAGKLDYAIECFEAAGKRAEGALSVHARRLLADARFRRGRERLSGNPQHAVEAEIEQDFEVAASIYEEVALPEIGDYASQRLALCLFRLGRFRECMKICERAQEEGRHPAFTELEALIYAHHQQYERAARAYRWLATHVEDDEPFLLKLAQNLLAAGRTEDAKEAVDQVAQRLEAGDAEGCLVASRAYLETKAYRRAVDFAYRALKAAPGRADIHQFYIQLFLTYGDYFKGKHAILEEHVEAYQDALKNYEARFPEHQFIKMVEMPEEPEKMAERLLELLPPAEAQERSNRILREGSIPLGAAAEAMGRSVPSLWRLVTERRSFSYRAVDGRNEVHESETSLASNAGAVMVGLVPLLTLERLGLLEIFQEAVEDVYVPTAVCQLLREVEEDEGRSEGSERMRLGAEGDKLISVTSPAAIEDAWLARIRRVLRFIEHDSVIIVGQTIGRDPSLTQVNNLGSDRTLHDILGTPDAEALIESQVQGLALYAEHVVLRSMARERGVSAFGTRALLDTLLDRKALDRSRYHEAVLELIGLGYEHPLIRTETILYALWRDGFLDLIRSRTALGALSHPQTNPYALVRIGVVILMWLWTRPLDSPFVAGEPTLITSVTWRVLDALSKERQGYPRGVAGQVISLVQAVMDSKLLLNVEREFVATCRAWTHRTTDVPE